MIETTENALDKALRLFANEPSFQKSFHRILLDSKIYIIGQAVTPIDNHTQQNKNPVLMPGQNISILNWESRDGFPVIPMFSSLQHLRSCINQTVNYMAFPARILFTMTLGAILILNPRTEYMLELFPSDITGLLEHTLVH